ncbi:hypothetical protein DACRYDRAFT_23819 [Dacryopinax primogenitus]|uniref:Cytochrome c oxidase assembly protein COX19 n=1 Tax=Dacryopinax primogenitus (strain DJM 731) TaxID=1858805 RepID=M5FUQ2_DACPD|nr:uncharacterized protein DACRYDRAFT_23819 [Dacryopinax primogenitus]EJT99209.1 hypothetical protein DACRYDRAFT_23819 [Dacryopinax primogenitus]
MSFGRPPTFQSFVVTPPERGSFPLDHDGECKQFMQVYLNCLKQNKSQSQECRPQSKAYLECRMTNGLMERDSWDNLGLAGVPDTPAAAVPTHMAASASKPEEKKDKT